MRCLVVPVPWLQIYSRLFCLDRQLFLLPLVPRREHNLRCLPCVQDVIVIRMMSWFLGFPAVCGLGWLTMTRAVYPVVLCHYN